MQKKSIRNIPIPDGRRARSHSIDTPQQDEQPPVIHDETITITRRPAVHNHRTVEAPDPVAEHHHAHHSVSDEMPEEEYEPKQRRVVSFEDEPKRKKGKRGSRVGIFSGVVVLFVLALVLIFFSFGGATVNVYARQVTTNVNDQLTALNVATQSELEAPLTFASQNIVAEATRKVEATGEEEVIEKAVGTITIHNEYSEEDQRLIKNTRFQSPDGFIFRIPESVVVPGLTRDSAGNVVPGKIKTQVVADQPGKEYNIAATRFAVPGFEGLPQYDSFYAVSETAMSGGFNGVKKIVSDEDRNRAERELRDDIKEQLLTQAAAQTTDELLVLIDDSLTVYETLDEVVQGDTVTLGMRGTTKTVVLSTQDLARALAINNLNSFTDTDTVQITNLADLRIRALASTGDVDFETVRVAVEGDAEFEWKLDEEAFKKQLAGAERDALSEATRSFNAVTRADAKVRPIWKSTFPDNTDKIRIVYIKE